MSNRAGPKADVLQGTLDLMVLRTLDSLGPLHGYAIAARLEQVSNRTARFYSVTSPGRRQLAREKDASDRMSGIIHTVLHGEA